MPEFTNLRKEMVELMQREGIKDKLVLEAMEKVPRHLFVQKDDLDQSYSNIPLHISKGQTISQPFTIAVMLEALELKKGLKVFEVGACSAYTAALIAHIIAPKGTVYTTEIIPELYEYSKTSIEKAKIKNIKLFNTDGSIGFKKYAPFDRIIITAACPKIPPPLIKQLKEGGIIVAPVSSLFGQKMIQARKIKGKIIERNLGYFMFVPLKGKYGY